jgi:hypothetical protein
LGPSLVFRPGTEYQRSSTVVAVATAAFGVISTMVSGYFGVKVGTDSAQGAASKSARTMLAASGDAIVDAHRRGQARADAIMEFVPDEHKQAAQTAAANAS